MVYVRLLCTRCVPGPCEGQKRILDLLDMELQTTVATMQMLGLKHGFSVRAASAEQSLSSPNELWTESQVLVLCGEDREDFTEQGASYPRREGWMKLCPKDRAEGQSRQKQKEKSMRSALGSYRKLSILLGHTSAWTKVPQRAL